MPCRENLSLEFRPHVHVSVLESIPVGKVYTFAQSFKIYSNSLFLQWWVSYGLVPQLESLFWKRKMFCFQKGLVRQAMPWARLDGKSSGRILKRKGKGYFQKYFQTSLGRDMLLQKKICKTTPAWKSTFGVNYLSSTDPMHYSISLFVGEGGLAEYVVLNPCFVVVFREEDQIE